MKCRLRLYKDTNSGKREHLEALHQECVSFVCVCVEHMLEKRRYRLAKPEKRSFFSKSGTLCACPATCAVLGPEVYYRGGIIGSDRHSLKIELSSTVQVSLGEGILDAFFQRGKMDEICVLAVIVQESSGEKINDLKG